ncbi:MAG: DUF4339 domain-containing protein [Chlamydiia bacterium]|nr:DUF4339 domain-containing protein [Chlamydiia bacterium]
MGILTLLIYLSFCAWVSYLALKRGRDPTNWFFIALFFGILGLIALLLMPRLEEPVSEDPLSGKQWYYLNPGRKIKGPCSASRLRQLLTSGDITLETLVWCEGMPDWKPLKGFS